MGQLTSALWWQAAAKRGLRTAILIAIPYVAAGITGTAQYVTIASAAGMGFVLSVLTSLVGIKEAQGIAVPWWYATVDRVVRTTAQALVTAVGTAVLFTDVDWAVIVPLVATSAFGSLLLAVLGTLPEADDPIATAATTTEVPGEDGPVIQAIPVVQTTDETINKETIQ